jgi:hypothetical protein
VEKLHLVSEVEEGDVTGSRSNGEGLGEVVCFSCSSVRIGEAQEEREKRTSAERNPSDFSRSLSIEPNPPETLSQPNIEEDAGATRESDTEHVDGGRL